jgi:hypothetical protein
LKNRSSKGLNRSKYKSVRRLMLCLLMLSLMLLLTNCAYSSTPTTEIKFEYVPQGYVAPSEGYWLDVPTGRNLLHMIRTYREQSEYWEKSHGALSEEFKAYIDKTNERLTGIETNIEAERRAWKNEIRKAKLPGVGVFAGAGYGSAGQVQAVIGVGLVWRLW